MALTDQDYTSQTLALLPTGAAWPREADSALTKLLAAIATELARADRRAEDLLDENDPRTTSQMVVDWERFTGLPDTCLSLVVGVEERRRRVHQRLVWRGGQASAFFVELLEVLGFPGCTIEEFRPMRVTSKCNSALNGGGWRYAWRVKVPATANVKPLTVKGRCNEPLASWGDPGLACLLARYKPAHSKVFISYGVDA